jgi:uncharacterized protein (UPF0548 family)
MVSNQLGMTPTRADCKLFEVQQVPSGRVLFDPTLKTLVYGNKETFMIANDATTVVYKHNKLDIPGLDAAIQQTLQGVQ